MLVMDRKSEEKSTKSHIPMNNDIPSVLKETSRTLLLSLLKSIDGRKSLIVENQMIAPLDCITKEQQLRACGVERIFRLEAKESPRQANRCVYLVRSSITTTKMIADHIKADKHSQSVKEFWIIFVPRRLAVCDKLLELEGVYGYAKLLEFPMGLLPIDSDMLSLELLDFYYSYFLNNDQTHLHTAAMSIVYLQRLFGAIPVVCGQGKCAEKIMEMVRTIMDESEEAEKEGSSISHLILFDRDVDYVSVLLTQLNYEGLLDETYDIKSGRITFGKDVTGQGQDIKIVLSDDDVIFKEIRNRHFTSVLGILQEMARQLQLKHDKKNKMTISDMKEIIAQKMKTAPQEKLLPLYLNTCEVIIKQKNMVNFQEQLSTEQGLIAGSKLKECIAFIEETINKQVPLLISLRLLCLLSITQDGIPSKDYRSLLTQFLQSYGHKHIVTLHNLKKLGLCVEQVPFYKPAPVTSSSSAGKLAEKVAAAMAVIPKERSFRAIARKFSLLPTNNTDIDLKNPTELNYVFSGAYIPIVGKLTEEAVQYDSLSKLEESLKCLPGKTVHCVPSSKLSETSASHAKKIVMVYFLGGVTYAEVAALRLLAKLKGFKLIVATTSIVNGNTLMKVLMPEDAT